MKALVVLLAKTQSCSRNSTVNRANLIIRQQVQQR